MFNEVLGYIGAASVLVVAASIAGLLPPVGIAMGLVTLVASGALVD